jgi:hypothetical protein
MFYIFLVVFRRWPDLVRSDCVINDHIIKSVLKLAGKPKEMPNQGEFSKLCPVISLWLWPMILRQPGNKYYANFDDLFLSLSLRGFLFCADSSVGQTADFLDTPWVDGHVRGLQRCLS